MSAVKLKMASLSDELDRMEGRRPLGKTELRSLDGDLVVPGALSVVEEAQWPASLGRGHRPSSLPEELFDGKVRRLSFSTRREATNFKSKAWRRAKQLDKKAMVSVNGAEVWIRAWAG